MTLMRISAFMAVVLALLGVAVFLIPLFYSRPLQIDLRDIISAISIAALLAGAFIQLTYADSFALIFAWSWSLALKASALLHVIIDPHDFTSTLSRLPSNEAREQVHHQFERAHQIDIQLALIGLALPLIGLILLLVGKRTVVQKSNGARRENS